MSKKYDAFRPYKEIQGYQYDAESGELVIVRYDGRKIAYGMPKGVALDLARDIATAFGYDLKKPDKEKVAQSGGKSKSNGVSEQAERRESARKLKGELTDFGQRAARLDAARRVERECENVKRFLNAAKMFYERIREAEREYQNGMKPRISAFSELMSDLACFAGCRTPEQFDALETTLSNQRSHIRYLMKRYRNQPALFDADSIPAFPDYPKPKEAAVPPPDTEYASSALRKQVDTALAEINAFLNAPDKRSFAAWKKLSDDCQKSVWARDANPGDAETARKNMERMRESAKGYLSDAGKLKAYLIQREKHWDYALLLCKAYPVLQKIADSPETLSETWCAAIGRELWDMLDSARQEDYRKIQFRWIPPDSEESRRSESIRVDFPAREASWPGLYCYERGHDDALICVIHGGVDDSVSFGKEGFP